MTDPLTFDPLHVVESILLADRTTTTCVYEYRLADGGLLSVSVKNPVHVETTRELRDEALGVLERAFNLRFSDMTAHDKIRWVAMHQGGAV